MGRGIVAVAGGLENRSACGGDGFGADPGSLPLAKGKRFDRAGYADKWRVKLSVGQQRSSAQSERLSPRLEPLV
jgi:hypothetical protein